MREITSHVVNPANDKLKIEVTDQPGAGGANHRYEVTGFDTAGNPSRTDSAGYDLSFSRLVILFQNGPIGENSVNGITQEVLLAIVADRLEAFQTGPFACSENRNALAHIQDAITWLQSRTKDRMARSVEGKTVA